MNPIGAFQPRLVCDSLILITHLSHWVCTALKTSKNVIADQKKICFGMDVPPQETTLKKTVHLKVGGLAIILW